MESITDYKKFIKSRQSYHARKARTSSASKQREAAARHKETASRFESILSWISSVEQQLGDAVPETVADADLFSLNPLEMESLPEDLSSQLNVSQGDTEDAQVLELLKIAGRPLDLNELLIGCYRKYNVKHKRNQLTARIYRLIKRELIHKVGKGTYALGSGPKDEDSLPGQNIKPEGDEECSIASASND